MFGGWGLGGGGGVMLKIKNCPFLLNLPEFCQTSKNGETN